jgi:hypothetical protein
MANQNITAVTAMHTRPKGPRIVHKMATVSTTTVVTTAATATITATIAAYRPMEQSPSPKRVPLRTYTPGTYRRPPVTTQ